MVPGQSQLDAPKSFATVNLDDRLAGIEEHDIVSSTTTNQNGFALGRPHSKPANHVPTDSFVGTTDFSDFNFQYDDLPEADQIVVAEDHASDAFAHPPRGSISSAGDPTDPKASGDQISGFGMADQSLRSHSLDGSDDNSPENQHATGTSLEDAMSDEFGLNAQGLGDGTDLGGKPKLDKSDPAPAWSELKTKAGKERKRLPLACIACRRKKIRCSGEKPACKHCLRARTPCVYKVTTRKAAPRTDYMAMLDKRLKRMEDRIIKILPKAEQEAPSPAVIRAIVKPAIPGAVTAAKQASKKRAADEAFGVDFDHWVKPGKAKPEDSNKLTSLQIQEVEESKLLIEGADALPPKDIQEHLAEVFFDNIYGQAYHLLHKPSYMRKLKAGALPPVLILSVCAVSARFSTHQKLNSPTNFLRGEEWASHAREIVLQRYEWPNITVLTCLLLLGLHEFGTCHGGRSWALGGQAVRMAFALQLHKDLDHDPLRPNKTVQLSFIDREIRRRTMWACFLMDRFNSSGTDRPMFIKEETLKIQLPIKEKYFQLDMPGPTEDLHGHVPYPVPEDEGQLSDAKSNMGVAAYMIRAISLWGKIINFLNQGGMEADAHAIWSTESEYSNLLKQAEELPKGLPDSLQYTKENLHLHDTDRMANQFLFLHISIQQNILFMNRFAVSSPAAPTESDALQSFITKAGSKAFAAANRISDLINDAEGFMVAAPFVGYCAFLSSTVHIFGIFSGNGTMEAISKKNLGINVRFLTKMRRYWGMFYFMAENLREQYKSCADAYQQGVTANDQSTTSPVFQYGDWFDRYPHGVSQSDFLEPAGSKSKESGGDAVLEQKAELRTVEEFFDQLSPPQSAGSKDAPPGRASATKRKSVAKKGGAPARSEQQVLEPLHTDVGQEILPEQIQRQLQQQQRQFASMGGQNAGSAAFNARSNSGAQNAAYQQNLSPISPVAINQFAHPQRHMQNPAFYNNPDLVSMSLANNGPGMLPQLDRQLVFGAYGGLDPNNLPTSLGGSDGMMDWEALASGNRDGTGGQAGNGLPQAFEAESSPAWFMPFNMEPPEMGQDLGTAMGHVEGFPGIFSPGGSLSNPGAGMGMRRPTH